MKIFAEEVKDLHAQGLQPKQIQKKLGCGYQTVRRRMREQGLEAKNPGKRKSIINEKVFDKIDNEESAYWLGFMLADGCIGKQGNTKKNKRRCIRVFLKQSDKGHLKKLAKFFNWNEKFHADDRDNHPRLGIVFNSVPLAFSLLEKKWMKYKNKGGTEILDYVPDDLFHHYVRGYYDGDGCISNLRNIKKSWYVNIVCKYEDPLVYMRDKIDTATGVNRKVHKRPTVYSLKYGGRNQVQTVLDWMYKDATIYLERKRIRKLEFEGNDAFQWCDIHDFSFELNTEQLKARKDYDDVVENFTNHVKSSGWKTPTFDIKSDLERCNNIKVDDYIKDGKIINKSGATPGNHITLNFQPKIWCVSQNHNSSISQLTNNKKTLDRAINNFFETDKPRNLYPERFVRELLFAGFTRGSVTPVPAFLAAIEKFGLSGKWFDPCAGWGNRLLAAKLADIDYEATDPGISFSGLQNLKKWLKSDAVLHSKKWQDVEWPDAGFVMTSTPFWNKEDYLDNTDYGTFEEWYQSFLKPLIEKSLQYKSVILHTDNDMKNRINKDYKTEVVPLISSSNRKKAPTEFFVNIEDIE